MKKYLIVGAGVSGCVAARVLAERGIAAIVIDKRDHVGGNAYDYRDGAGITVHRYGPHIFHTGSKKVWDFLSRFTEWHLYQHRVLSYVWGMLVPIPINIDTVNMLYGFSYDADSIESFYGSRGLALPSPANFKEAVTSRVGEELYDLLFKNYTRKQWDMDGKSLPASIASRVLTRSTRDSRYFTDRYQGIPNPGYTEMFKSMLSHPNIEVRLDCPYSDLSASELSLPTLYTGSIDEFFEYRFGPLPYRSLIFDFKTVDCEQFQPVAVVNYPNDYDFTRITEFKHFTGERSDKTTIVFESPSSSGEPYYPLPTAEAQTLYQKYAAITSDNPHIRFLGRLGSYRYMNIDQVALEAMDVANIL